MPKSFKKKRTKRQQRSHYPKKKQNVSKKLHLRRTKIPGELQLKRAYPKLSLHLLSSTIQQALRDKFNQIIPFSKIGDKTGKEGITYFELFQALSGFDYVKQQPYIVMI